MALRGPQEPQEELIMGKVSKVTLITNDKREGTLKLVEALTTVLEAAYKNTGGDPGSAKAYEVVTDYRDALRAVHLPKREENV